MDRSTYLEEGPLDQSAILTAAVVRYCMCGDQDACAEAVEILMPKIRRLAKGLADRAFGLAPVEDLIGAGIEECLRCINNYDTKQGPFLQYALRSIRGNMFHFLRDKTLDVKVSGRAKETMYAVNKFIKGYKQKTGIEPDIGTICQGLGYSYTRVEDALGITKFITAPKQVEDYSHVVIANLDGTPDGEDPDTISPEDAKDIVATMVELRKRGKQVEDYMALYGLDRDVAVNLVEAIDVYYMTGGTKQRFNSLVDWTAFTMELDASYLDNDLTM